jgi:hypothetical protein
MRCIVSLLRFLDRICRQVVRKAFHVFHFAAGFMKFSYFQNMLTEQSLPVIKDEMKSENDKTEKKKEIKLEMKLIQK